MLEKRAPPFTMQAMSKCLYPDTGLSERQTVSTYSMCNLGDRIYECVIAGCRGQECMKWHTSGMGTKKRHDTEDRQMRDNLREASSCGEAVGESKRSRHAELNNIVPMHVCQ